MRRRRGRVGSWCRRWWGWRWSRSWRGWRDAWGAAQSVRLVRGVGWDGVCITSRWCADVSAFGAARSVARRNEDSLRLYSPYPPLALGRLQDKKTGRGTKRTPRITPRRRSSALPRSGEPVADPPSLPALLYPRSLVDVPRLLRRGRGYFGIHSLLRSTMLPATRFPAYAPQLSL